MNVPRIVWYTHGRMIFGAELRFIAMSPGRSPLHVAGMHGREWFVMPAFLLLMIGNEIS